MRTRTKEIKIRLSEEELKKLDAMVAKTVHSREGFLRLMLAGYQIPEAPNEDIRELLSQITRLGNNVNIMLYRLNTEGFTSWEQLQKAMDDLWVAQSMIRSLFCPYHIKRGTMRKEYQDE